MCSGGGESWVLGGGTEDAHGGQGAGGLWVFAKESGPCPEAPGRCLGYLSVGATRRAHACVIRVCMLPSVNH